MKCLETLPHCKTTSKRLNNNYKIAIFSSLYLNCATIVKEYTFPPCTITLVAGQSRKLGSGRYKKQKTSSAACEEDDREQQ